MRSWFHGLRGNERGATFVEFALVVPILLSLVLAIFTGGQAYSRKISLVESVREGARYGASLQLGSGANAVTDWENAVRARVVQESAGELTAASVCVRLVLPTGGNDCGVPDPPGAAGEPAVHLVKVSGSASAKVQFFFFSTTSSLNSELAARYERDTG